MSEITECTWHSIILTLGLGMAILPYCYSALPPPQQSHTVVSLCISVLSYLSVHQGNKNVSAKIQWHLWLLPKKHKQLQQTTPVFITGFYKTVVRCKVSKCMRYTPASLMTTHVHCLYNKINLNLHCIEEMTWKVNIHASDMTEIYWLCWKTPLHQSLVSLLHALVPFKTSS